MPCKLKIKKPIPSATFIRRAFSYDPENGHLTWRYRPEEHFKLPKTHKVWNAKYANRRAGTVNSNGYRVITFSSFGAIIEHHIIWVYVYGDWPKDQLDHINRNRLDNRIENLREASARTNALNRGMRKDNKSGFTGVHFAKNTGKWEASLRFKGVLHRAPKQYEIVEEAAEARRILEVLYNETPQEEEIDF